MALSQVQLERLHTSVTDKIGERKNLIINGAMKVAQRGNVSSVQNGYGGADRFSFRSSGAVVVTLRQQGTGNSPTDQGFGFCQQFDVTTADSSLAATDFARIQYRFEGQDLQLLKKGTSNAEQVTLSFFVKSPKTGTHIVELVDQGNSRAVSLSYTVSSANTYEKKTLTFPADTTGTITNDNARRMDLNWYLAAGSNLTSGTLQTTWASTTDANRAVGQVNCVDSTDNNFFITGVQLELGTVATDFEHRLFPEDLALCQRYCCKWDTAGATTNNHSRFPTAYNQNSSSAMMFLTHPVPMRVTDGRTITHNIGVVEILTPGNNTSSLTLSGDGSSNMISAVSLNSIGSVTQHALCAPRVGSGQTDWYIIIACEL
tara:strand:+ start:107 stop:1225 length:1119 start_codon:yes stop_codon:yes gene_type:complete